MASGGLRPDCLTEDEIVQFVSMVFDLDIVKEQLTNPFIVTRLYNLFLATLGVSDTEKPDLNATQGIEHHGRYSDFVLLSNVHLCVGELLRQTNFPAEFTLLDMVQPKKKKVLRILSHLIKLWTDADALHEEWKAKEADLEVRKKERQAQHQRLQALQKTLEQKALMASKCRESKADLEKRLEAAHQDFNYQKGQGETLSAQYYAEKKALAEKKEQLSELDVELKKLQEEIGDLESQIVRSPDKITAETNAMEQHVAAKMSERRRLQQEYVEAVNQSDTVLQAQRDLKPAMDTLHHTFSDLEILREKCNVADEMKEKIVSLNQKDRELHVVAEQSRENVTGLQNQVKKNRIQYQHQLNPLLKMNDGVKQDIARKREASDGSSAEQKKLLQQEMSLLKQQEDLKSERQLNDQQFAACVTKVTKAIQSAIDSKLGNVIN